MKHFTQHLGARTLLSCVAVVVVSARAPAQAPTVDHHLGDMVPLNLTFKDEAGATVTLAELVDRPIVLSLIYYRCPGACSPLARAVATAVDNCDLRPGENYRLLTISFDPREGPELGTSYKTSLLRDMKNTVPPDSWRFLSGDQKNIDAVTTAVGFKVIPKDGDFLHPLTLMFLSPKGKITRYINVNQDLEGEIKILPAEVKMAVMDASEGRVGSFIQKLERFCYGYDPATQKYIVKVNRIILGVTVLFVLCFGAFLLLFRRKGETKKGPGGPVGKQD